MPSELLRPLCLGITRRRTSWPVVACQGEIYPQDNAFSQSLAGAGAEHSQDLAKLSGTAFDRAYAQNELAYHVFVTGALETTLIPSAQNSQVKSLLQNGLALFEQPRNEAAQLASQLK
jgi:putative membrane protein